MKQKILIPNEIYRIIEDTESLKKDSIVTFRFFNDNNAVVEDFMFNHYFAVSPDILKKISKKQMINLKLNLLEIKKIKSLIEKCNQDLILENINKKIDNAMRNSYAS